MRTRIGVITAALPLAALALLAGGCSSSSTQLVRLGLAAFGTYRGHRRRERVRHVIAQIGGKYVPAARS